ncbi:MAG: lipopolysaccharide biosynthesis protein [Acidobacteriota bacterium]|nr:lipopolysaccharide biosynthesis protein [Acidobacteriota bacterium]
MSAFIRRVAAGAGWLYAYRWLERLLDFLSVVVLARLLSPDDFGLVAIAASVAAIVEGLSAFDVNKALIRSREDDRGLFDSAWTLSVLRGLLAALCMVAVAPFLDDHRLSQVLLVLAVSPLLNGLANPRFVLFERELVYSRLAVLTLGSRLVAVTLTLGLAVVYRSYWALVLGMVAGSLVSLILSYALRPYRPRPSFARFDAIFAFSGWLSLTSVVTTLAMETDRILVGKLVGIADAGLYFMTQRVGVLPTRELISPLQRLLFPSFSELAEDRGRLRRGVQESINVLGSLSLPAACGFALVANDFVPLVLGDQWQSIVPLLTVLVPYLGLRATLSMALPCVMALGETRLLFWVSFVYALVHLPVFIAGTILFALPGAIGGIVLAGVLYIYLNAWMLRRTLEISIPEILRQLRRPLLATALMVAAILGADALLVIELFTREGSWLALAVKIPLGGVVFCSALAALWRLEGRPAGIERRMLELLAR